MENRQFDGPSPPTRSVRRDIIRIKETSPQQFTLLSVKPYTVHYHWIGGRSQQCSGQHETCPGCIAGSEQKWVAYLHAIRWADNSHVFIELTEVAVMQILKLAHERETLRGTVLKICKTKGGPRGRYIIDLLERVVPPSELPEWERPDDLLQKLWKAKRN